MRLDKITTKFQEALAEAQTLALGNDHAYIEPEHLLVAMLRQEDGPRALLQRAGVNIPGLLASAEAAMHKRPKVEGQEQVLQGSGNGPIDAFVVALSEYLGRSIDVMDYHEHAIGAGADAQAASYVELRVDKGKPVHGVGMSPDIVTASLKAIISALNRVAREGKLTVRKAA